MSLGRVHISIRSFMYIDMEMRFRMNTGKAAKDDHELSYYVITSYR